MEEIDSYGEMLKTYSLLQHSYGDLSFEDFACGLKEMIERNNFRMVGAFLSADRALVGVSGYWISYMFYCGLYLQASSLMVDSKYRSFGIGSKILCFLEDKAKNYGCKKLVLDSYTENKRSHSLYFRNNFYIRGFHFIKDL